MSKSLKTILATAFAASCMVGSSVAFAADNSGNKNKESSMPRMNDTMKTDPSTTGSIKCDDSNANINSGCDKPGHLKQEEKMQQEQ